MNSWSVSLYEILFVDVYVIIYVHTRKDCTDERLLLTTPILVIVAFGGACLVDDKYVLARPYCYDYWVVTGINR